MSASCSNEAEHSQNIVPWWMFSGTWPCFFLNEKKSFLVINTQNKLSKNKGKLQKINERTFFTKFQIFKEKWHKITEEKFCSCTSFLFISTIFNILHACWLLSKCVYMFSSLKTYNSLDGITYAQLKIMKQIAGFDSILFAVLCRRFAYKKEIWVIK